MKSEFCAHLFCQWDSILLEVVLVQPQNCPTIFDYALPFPAVEKHRMPNIPNVGQNSADQLSAAGSMCCHVAMYKHKLDIFDPHMHPYNTAQQIYFTKKEI